ncbi:MAG: flagellar hook assembly protein FlgD [Devosiaceae bacterium]
MNGLEQIASNSAAQAQLDGAQRDGQMLADDFDTFLQLLTTQLRNQDPLEPMDTNQFTQQLVQFSGVEQQIQTNSYLESLIGSTEAQAVNAVVGYLGSIVTADGTTTNLENGSASWMLNSDALAGASTITISDENGRQVFSTPHSVPRGESTFSWDGRMSNGQTAPNGTYSIQVIGNTNNNVSVDVDTAISGEVTAVDVTSGEPMLQIGGVEVSLGAIRRVDRSS